MAAVTGSQSASCSVKQLRRTTQLPRPMFTLRPKAAAPRSQGRIPAAGGLCKCPHQPLPPPAPPPPPLTTASRAPHYGLGSLCVQHRHHMQQHHGHKRKPSRMRFVSASYLDNNEAIGAEHGEGFATFRPRGPLQVDVDYLNDRMQSQGLQRIRFAMRPDEAFGLIYSWDNVIADTRSLRLQVWQDLAKEAGKPFPPDSDVSRMLTSQPPERTILEVLRWTDSKTEAKELTDRAGGLYKQRLSQVRAPRAGVREWLQALAKAGVPCAVASSIDRLTLLAALDRMGLVHFFRAFVSSEDGMESIAHRFLSAAVKLDRPPSKCVVFEDDPRGITAAHNCSMKAVALIGQHTAYELQQADLAVGSFTDLSVINLRRLFANRGHGLEFMEVQKLKDGNKMPKRKNTMDTIF